MGFSRVPLDRIVRIVVQIGDQEHQGTGFRFSSDRVVTAFHVIDGAEVIRVHEPDGSDGWKEPVLLDREAGHGVVWSPVEVETDLDAAVLSTPEVSGKARAPFCGNPWSARHPWGSHGFPAIEPETAKGFYGRAFPCPIGSGFFELTVADTYVEDLEAWGGLSGAPVILQIPRLGSVFGGVIGEGPPDAKGSRLWATALPALLDERSFRIALLGSEPDWFEEYVDRVHEKLQGDELATTEVCLALGLDHHPRDSKQVAQNAINGVEVRDICMALAKAAKKLDQKGKQSSGHHVRNVLAAVAPVQFLRSQGITPPDSKTRRIDLEVASDLGAEAVVAAMQRRLMEVEAVPNDIPQPRWKVSEPGVFGIDLDGSDAVADVVEELRKLVELTSGPARSARAYLVHFAEEYGLLPESLKRRISELEESDETWKKVVSRAVNRRLGALTDAERYYFLMALEKDSERKEQFLERLGEDLPELLVVTRTGNSADQVDTEDAQLQSPFEHAFSGKPSEDTTK